MSRAFSLDGVPVAKPPRKKREKKPRVVVPPTESVSVPFVTVAAPTTQTVTITSSGSSSASNIVWSVPSVEECSSWTSLKLERMRNKELFGLPVLDKDLPRKLRKRREKEKAT